jgi:hypothetical protein
MSARISVKNRVQPYDGYGQLNYIVAGWRAGQRGWSELSHLYFGLLGYVLPDRNILLDEVSESFG